MAAVRNEILGRGAELTALDRFVDSLADRPSALLIAGRPGIGKTTVWLRGVDTAAKAGHRVLASRSVEAEAKMSFTTLGDLLGDVIDEAAVALPEPQRRAFDAALLRAGSGDMRPDRRAVSLATSAVLRSLAGAGPVLLAIDDVQWIDAASARVLSFAIRRLGEEAVGILAALRVEPGSKDPLDLRSAFVEPACVTIQMGPLDVMPLSQLLRHRLGAEFPHTTVTRIHAVCEGNPFFALEIGRALLLRDVSPDPGEPVPIPDDLRSLVRSRLRTLPVGARDALLVISAAVRPTVDLVRSAVARPARTAADLVVASEVGVIEIEHEVVRFTHPLLASTVYSDAPADERRAAHRRLAHVVADDEERVRHLAMAASGPDEGVATALDGAAVKALSRGAPDSAAHLQELAVRLTPTSNDDGIRARSVLAAEYRYAAGDVRIAHDRLERLIATTPKGPERAEIRYELSRMLWNDVGRIRGLLEQAIEEAGDQAPAALRVSIEEDMGWVNQMGGDLLEGSRLGRGALAAAEEIGDPSLVARVLTFLGYVEFLMGRPTRAELERAMSLEEVSGSQPVRYVIARRVLGATLMWAGALDEARVELERDHRETVRLGGLSYIWEGLVFLAELELRAGNWDMAARYAADGLESTVETGLEQAREVHLWSTALVSAHRGDVKTARVNATEGLRIAEAHGDVFHVVTNRSVMGFLELSLGNPEGAHAWMGPLAELSESWGVDEPGAFPYMADEIEALIALGECDAAETLLERLEAQGRTLDRALALATGARCRGLLAAATGDTAGALAAMEEALMHHQRLPQPFDLARTLLVEGQIQRRFKKKAAARKSLERAQRIFEDLGATLWFARAQDELGRIGGRPGSTNELTESERQVAQLVGEGKTNAEVAALLFMSVHTVRSNLRRIYGKLEIRSRSELAHQLRNSGDPPQGPATD